MKNIVKLFGISALTVVILFSLTAAACGNKSSSSSEVSRAIDNIAGEDGSSLYSIISGSSFIESGNLYSGNADYSDNYWISITENPIRGSVSGIVWGGGKFVAVGEHISYSTDGINWTVAQENIFSDTGINCVTWGNNRFIAAGDYGKMAYSADGINWTAVSPNPFEYAVHYDYDIKSITWGNNLFVAAGYKIGQDCKIAYSSDGINWTAAADTTFSQRIYSVTWGSNKFVAVGDYRRMAYSPDGINWTRVTDSSLDELKDEYGMIASFTNVTWCNNKFFAFNDKLMAYSSDGVNWTGVNFIFSIDSIAWGNGMYAAVGYGGKIAYSADGINWTAEERSPFQFWEHNFRIAYGGNKFVVRGSDRMAYLQP